MVDSRPHAQQKGSGDAEDRRVRPNAERRRQHHDGGEAGSLAQHPEGEAGVSPNGFQPAEAVQAADFLANHRGIARLAADGVARRFRRWPARRGGPAHPHDPI